MNTDVRFERFQPWLILITSWSLPRSFGGSLSSKTWKKGAFFGVKSVEFQVQKCLCRLYHCGTAEQPSVKYVKWILSERLTSEKLIKSSG